MFTPYAMARLALGLVLVVGLHTAQGGLSGVVTQENLGSTLAKLATARGEVIFTTFVLDPENKGMGMMKSFGYWLNCHGLLPHTMLLTRDERSYNIVAAEGLPAYWDQAWPLPPKLIHREFEQSKHWWGAEILRQGFKALFLDNDNILLQNPLPTFDADYDVQGLSDWHEAELPAVGEMAGREGGLGYKWTPSGRPEYGGQLAAFWLMNEEQKKCNLPFPNPAQSTGVIYLKPTNATVRFMEALYRRVSDEAPHQWEQASFNELIMSYLVGFGDDPPIRYRVLPVSQFANIEVYDARIKANLFMDQVIIHAGYVNGAENKEREYKRLNVFFPDFKLDETNLNLTAPRSAEPPPALAPPPSPIAAEACDCPPSQPSPPCSQEQLLQGGMQVPGQQAGQLTGGGGDQLQIDSASLLLAGLKGRLVAALAPMLLGLALGYGTGLALYHYRSHGEQEYIKGWRMRASSA